jgi:dipeptidyl aminopeptidase/acylaminoacyl peptidase
MLRPFRSSALAPALGAGRCAFRAFDAMRRARERECVELRPSFVRLRERSPFPFPENQGSELAAASPSARREALPSTPHNDGRGSMMRHAFRSVAAALFLLILAVPAEAQYFGKNKVQWERFEFKTLRTEHFDIYYYEQEEDVVQDIGRMAERWYARLSRTFNHSFARKPIVLYANSADFHQTTTTGGLIGEGTGGFTDSIMNRVVLPLTGDMAENDHVLGHEIVHVFQYDIAATAAQQRRRFNLEALPLWLVEGMAEYFSKGRIDPLTSMWIRDATLHDRLPDLRKLERDPRYFPYRYGQALMAYIGARFGDEMVVRYFIAAGLVGVDQAFDRAIGIPSKQFFRDWQESARELYTPVTQARTDTLGDPLLGHKQTRGDLNIAPSFSPDGRYIAFLSTRSLFSIDLYLADAKTGQVIRRLVSSDRDSHFESLRFIDSAGGWSPDSTKIAFVTFARGDNNLSIVDVETRRTEHIPIAGLEAMTNPVWSPDGRTIAVSGQTTGVSDLFVYDLDSKQVRRLTNDVYADLQPAWSPDGRTLAFVTDRGRGTQVENLTFADMNIATIDVASGAIRELPLFPDAKHISPQWGPDGNSIYFVATPEGIPDIYRYSVRDNTVSQITRVQTGISGITELAPALTVAARTGDIAFSLFEDDKYNIYTLPPTASGPTVPTTAAPETARAALLPPLRAAGSEITGYLSRPEEGLPPRNTRYQILPYDAKLRLAYIGPPTIGIGVSNYGAGAGGSVAAMFSDILGEQNVGFAFAGGGSSGSSLADQLGGEVFYLNRKSRVNWGAEASHIPYTSQQSGYDRQVINIGGQQVLADIYQQLRQVQRVSEANGLVHYPLSTTRRVEGSAGFQRYSYKAELETLIAVGSEVIDRTVERLPGSFAFNLWRASTAFVGDSSTYGFISPINGTRYRYEVEHLDGDLQFETALADHRKYWFYRPVTFAVRGLHYGRYGDGAEDDRISQLHVGEGSLVRGYDPYSFNLSECNATPGSNACPVYDRLIGSKVAVASMEVRAPLFGTKEFGLFDAAFLPTEIMAFADAGAAWREGESVKLKYATDTEERVPVFSVGVGLRILLAYIPIEVYAAKPFQRPGEDIVYGFNIIPGW